jgi:hypothetical protein
MRFLISLFLFSLLINIVQGQPFSKNISREQLEMYLSKSVNAANLNELLRTSDGLYPGTNVQIVDNNELNLNPTVGSIDYIRKNDRQNGYMYYRYLDMLRLVENTGTLFVTEAASHWGAWDWPVHMNRCSLTVRDLKLINSNIVVQASLNEFVDKNTAEAIGKIPYWVFDAFGLNVEDRKFDIYKMMFSDWSTNNSHWFSYAGMNGSLPNAIVPDISQLETKLWFYYQSVKFIDMGCESIQFSQVSLMNNDSNDPTHWKSLFIKLKTYADIKPNIRFLILTGHTEGMKDNNGNLIFDCHSGPVRPSELGTNLNVNGGSCNITATSCNWGGKSGKIYTESLGGKTWSGWSCTSLPAYVFLDNYGNNGNESTWGQPMGGTCNMYHFDEISWFALQEKSYRDTWLKYAYYKVKCINNSIYFSLPVKRDLSYKSYWYPAPYLANNSNYTFLPSPNTINNIPNGLVDRNTIQLYAGYGQEDIIKELFQNQHQSPFNWTHHNFTDENVSNQPSSPHVNNSLIFWGTDRMYYIAADGYIHGYIKDVASTDIWNTVSPSYSAGMFNNQNVINQVKAKGGLTISPDGNTILYIGVDGYIHGFTVNNVWNYTYFDFVKSPMVNQKLKADKNLIFASNTRVYYVAKENNGTGASRVHGFIKNNGNWGTVSPTYASQVSSNSMVQVAGALTYSPFNNRLYYVGTDGFLYYYNIDNDWNYTYTAVPKTQLQSQNLRVMPNKIAIYNNYIYYIGKELASNNALRVHCLVESNNIWNTVSPSWSASAYNNQNINTQVQPNGNEITVSPNGQKISYIGSDNKVYYYQDINSGWNFSWNSTYGSNNIPASNSLQYKDENTLFYNSTSDKKVHYIKLQESYCQNPNINLIEQSFVYSMRSYEDVAYEDVNKTNDENSEIKIYPNPASSTINIEMNSDSNGYTDFNILDQASQIVKSGTITTPVSQLSVDHLPNGVYLIVIKKHNGTIFRQKIIIING